MFFLNFVRPYLVRLDSFKPIYISVVAIFVLTFTMFFIVINSLNLKSKPNYDIDIQKNDSSQKIYYNESNESLIIFYPGSQETEEIEYEEKEYEEPKKQEPSMELTNVTNKQKIENINIKEDEVGEENITYIEPEEQNKTKRVEKLNVTIPIHEQNQTLQKYANSLPEAVKETYISINIDDCGYDYSAESKWISLPYNISFAVLPYIENSEIVADFVRKQGKLLLLHMPMEAINPRQNTDKGVLLVNMSYEQIYIEIKRAMTSLGHVDGINNHKGSRFTANKSKMVVVFDMMETNNVGVFFDSRTSSKSISYKDCLNRSRLNCYTNNGFIDNSDNYADIIEKIIYFTEINQGKHFTLIGHCRATTFRALEDFLPILIEKGYKIEYFNNVNKEKEDIYNKYL